MTAVSFYVQVVRALDEIGVSYMIVGAFGGYPFGITRVTFDNDEKFCRNGNHVQYH
jgi:hypothetical protein